ncbi:hypothetical protein DEU56DRAFT_790837 [Suillus clintonianus]|uniref:uncharacterized protein n=1 Tax=Suillus clintonianus TaxID=1904413 RepID=UPI001B8644BC|nr:uncharacterized protein DEU56DRAFT_790837 [Suillus clintonianus]KAG2144260.1 hypothetical protein DEU56DRAFT_790837 [Suillus clintonianus]
MGPMPATYTSVPTVCYDILLLILAVAKLVKHLKERRNVNMKPNTSILMIVQYHIVYFVLNLTNQIFWVILWAGIPVWYLLTKFYRDQLTPPFTHSQTPAMSISELFNDTVPYILAPRLIISIWDTHAHDECVYISRTFEDCGCWTSPIVFEEREMEFTMESEMDSFVV